MQEIRATYGPTLSPIQLVFPRTTCKTLVSRISIIPGIKPGLIGSRVHLAAIRPIFRRKT